MPASTFISVDAVILPVKTTALGAFNSLSVYVSLEGANLFNGNISELFKASNCVFVPFCLCRRSSQITYGPIDRPSLYVCTLDASRSSFGIVTCLTQPNSQGLDLRFSVIFAGQQAISTDSARINVGSHCLTLCLRS